MYEWIKVIHIVAVISWMAGLLYLPRLMVYHFDTKIGSEASDIFKIMEKRLLRFIMTPAMIVSWAMGLWLMVMTQAHIEAWFVTKLFLVFLLSAAHGFQARWVKEFADDQRRHSVKFYRVVNEIPAVLMLLIVILVVVKPF